MFNKHKNTETVCGLVDSTVFSCMIFLFVWLFDHRYRILAKKELSCSGISETVFPNCIEVAPYTIAHHYIGICGPHYAQ